MIPDYALACRRRLLLTYSFVFPCARVTRLSRSISDASGGSVLFQGECRRQSSRLSLHPQVSCIESMIGASVAAVSGRPFDVSDRSISEVADS
jgi:hypothetical protein